MEWVDSYKPSIGDDPSTGHLVVVVPGSSFRGFGHMWTNPSTSWNLALPTVWGKKRISTGCKSLAASPFLTIIKRSFLHQNHQPQPLTNLVNPRCLFWHLNLWWFIASPRDSTVLPAKAFALAIVSSKTQPALIRNQTGLEVCSLRLLSVRVWKCFKTCSI